MLNGAFHTNLENFPYLMMYDKKTRRHGNALNVIFSTHKEAQVVYMTVYGCYIAIFASLFDGRLRTDFFLLFHCVLRGYGDERQKFINSGNECFSFGCVFLCELITNGTTLYLFCGELSHLGVCVCVCVCVGGGCSSQSFLWRDGAYLKTFQGI